MAKLDFLDELGIENTNLGGFSTEWLGSSNELESVTPADGTLIAKVKQCDSGDYERFFKIVLQYSQTEDGTCTKRGSCKAFS